MLKLCSLIRRRVAQRAVRPHRVLLPPEPRPFRPRIGHRLQLLTLQKLVAHRAVERLDIPVLPRAPRGHCDRLGPHAWRPVHQRRAEELRAVVATNPTRRPAPPDDPRRQPPHVRPVQRRGRVQRQALPGVFVNQRQPVERTAIGPPVVDEVAGPDVVLEPRRLSAGSVFGEQSIPIASMRPLVVRSRSREHDRSTGTASRRVVFPALRIAASKAVSSFVSFPRRLSTGEDLSESHFDRAARTGGRGRRQPFLEDGASC